MGFRFSYVCDLLARLEDNRHLKATSAARAQNPDFRTISNWCLNHSKRIHDKDTDLHALLSCLFPEKRPDRVYGLQHASLARVIGRCLYLGASRLKDLNKWQISGEGDLGDCVQHVMSQTENQIPAGQEVTVEEIDDALQRIASICRFSGTRSRKARGAVDLDEVLGSLYRRLCSRDAKWLTRMVLKSYYPVQLPVEYCLKNLHFLLPHLLLFQDSLEAAVDLVKSPSLKLFPPRPQSDFARLLSDKALEHFVPQLGIKVGRADYYKARSIKHCCSMIGQRRMSLERKYDGEYCQIHVDITKGQDCIQIFSKSGKDSTLDKAGIHDVIKRSLAIGEAHCKISRRCILEGELLVWDDRAEKILEFHKLRKFISRSGTFIGADLDSQPKPYEHLMIVFFDILLLDDTICLSKPHRVRRLLLKETVNVSPGRADIAEQEIIDFSRQDAIRRLQIIFARSITDRWEGLVIKACEEPYFSILSPDKADGFSRWIKLKKDYIPGLGDTADFALIGARYEAKDAALLSHIQHLSWTHFFIGCLDNKDDVIRLGSKPRFRIVDVIGTHSLNTNNMQVLNQLGKFVACDVDSNTVFESYAILSSLPRMDVAFKTPFVVELLGSGFEKPGNTQYYSLRFPRVLKIHWDRTYQDAVSFTELQDLAEKARLVLAEELHQESALWHEKVAATNKRNEYIVDKSQSTSFSTCTSPLSKAGSLISPDLTPPSSKEVRTAAYQDRTFTRPRHSIETLPSNLPAVHKRKTSPENISSSSNNTHPTSFKRLKPFSQPLSTIMEYSELEKKSRSQQLRARGSPIPRVWTASIGSSRSNPSSQASQSLSKVGSCATTPLRENPNLSSHVVSSRNHVNSNLSMKTVSDQDYSLVSSSASVMKNPTYCADAGPAEQTLPSAASHPIDDLLPAPSVLPLHLTSPLCTLPVYCGEYGFVENIFREAPRDFTFSATHFVQSLAFPHNRERLRASNPAAADNDMAYGIVLVNIRDPANTLATQLYNVGNQVAAQLCEPRSSLPSSGRIFFLDRRILNAGGRDGIHNQCFLLNDWWAECGTQYYYATIAWRSNKGPNQTSRFQVDGKENCEGGTDAAFINYRRATNVVNLYEPSDVEILGEFVSIEPTVHLHGDHYYVPSARKNSDVHYGGSLALEGGSNSWDNSDFELVQRHSSASFL